MIEIERINPLTAQTLLLKLSGEMDEGALRNMYGCVNFATYIYIGHINDKLVCLWGLCPPTLISDEAYLWLFTTPDLEHNEFLFVRHSQMAIAEALRLYPRITGVTESGNIKAQRWLKWLGAEFAPGSIDGHKAFVIDRKEVA